MSAPRSARSSTHVDLGLAPLSAVCGGLFDQQKKEIQLMLSDSDSDFSTARIRALLAHLEEDFRYGVLRGDPQQVIDGFRSSSNPFSKNLLDQRRIAPDL